MKPILEIKNLTKIFPGVIALDDVSMEFYPGEVHALVGENGAGKSTLIKTLTGINRPDKGEIIYEGAKITDFSPIASKKLQIGVIYQELSLVNHLSVAENIFLGSAPRKGILLDRKEMMEQAKRIFEEMDLTISPNVTVKDLSIGFQQMIELAKALAQNNRIIIMDEPTAPLSNSEVEVLFGLIEKLRKKGITIIYISHRLEEIFRISDRVTVLRDGKHIVTKETKDTDRDELICFMVGRSLKNIYPKRKPAEGKQTILETSHLSGNGIKDISLKLQKGEILGLGGLVGAGRTEFAQLLFGVKKKESGQIIYRGETVNIRNPQQAMQRGIMLVPEDRKRQGLILEHTINENITLAILKMISHFFIINRKKEASIVHGYINSLKIKSYGIKQKVKDLSGGNQQKIVVTKGLATDPEIIIFDEPTRGIDVGAKQEIYMLMNDLIEQGKTIIMITSEMEELLGMSDRIAVLCEGHLSAILKKEQFSAQTVLRYASEIDAEA